MGFICQAREPPHSSVISRIINPVRHNLMTQHKTGSNSTPLSWLETCHEEHTNACGPALLSWEWIRFKLHNESQYGGHMVTSGLVWQKTGRLEGGNARFNEMWVSAAHLHSSDLWRWLSGARRGIMWITCNRKASKWLEWPSAFTSYSIKCIKVCAGILICRNT